MKRFVLKLVGVTRTLFIAYRFITNICSLYNVEEQYMDEAFCVKSDLSWSNTYFIYRLSLYNKHMFVIQCREQSPF